MGTQVLRICAVCAIVASIGLAGGGRTANANHIDYHYAHQYAATSQVFYHHPDCCLIGGYFGWVGVNGLIQAPLYVPDLDSPSLQHTLGLEEMHFTNGGFVQIGWFSGRVGPLGEPCPGQSCILRDGTNGMYHEWLNPALGLYRIYDLGNMSIGQPVIYRVQYIDANSCWEVFKDYSVHVNTVCWLPSSGMPLAGSEVWQKAGGTVPMPLTYYGFSDPNTNYALRIKGSAGWEPWDPTLVAQTTSHYDERHPPVPDPLAEYRISTYQQWHHFKSWGEE